MSMGFTVKAFQMVPAVKVSPLCSEIHRGPILSYNHGFRNSLPVSELKASTSSSNHETPKHENSFVFFRRLRLLWKRLPLIHKNSAGKQLRSRLCSLVLMLAMTFSAAYPAWAAGKNGRMGGSFGRSTRFTRPPVHRVQNRPALGNQLPKRKTPAPIKVVYPHYNHRRRQRLLSKTRTFHGSEDPVAVVTAPDGTTSTVRKVNPHPFSDSRASDITIALTASAVVAHGVQKRRTDQKQYEDRFHPLGPGLSVWSLTASIDENPQSSIVSKIQSIAESTSTETREGLQSLIAETSLELARQLDQGRVASVESRYDHYHSSDQAVIRAERQYNRISARERSKFDQESWSSYNGKIVSGDSSSSPSSDASHIALVQIHLVLEGNSMKTFGARQVETRTSLRDALIQLSGDVSAVKDCVVAGEVLWAPQANQGGGITKEELYANYPRLWPLDYSS